MRYPRHTTLELTAKCNFLCPYCYCVWHEYPALAKPELDADGWKAILDTCAADFDKPRKRVVFADSGSIFALHAADIQGEPKKLHDFNDMKYERIQAPY